MTRARPLSSIVQDGRFVVACDPDMARPVLDEFAAAPVGKHDDTIDAVSRALNRLTETNRYNLEGLI
jgi:phage terminase large subunit-like protein